MVVDQREPEPLPSQQILGSAKLDAAIKALHKGDLEALVRT
jgi:hypothetical protein